MDSCVDHGLAGNRKGYASVRLAGGAYSSRHRVALEGRLGRPLRPGAQALHNCDNPRCVNPEHLYEGSAKDNMADRDRRGHNAKLRKRFCPHGHPYFGDNLRMWGGRRYCFACRQGRAA